MTSETSATKLPTHQGLARAHFDALERVTEVPVGIEYRIYRTSTA